MTKRREVQAGCGEKRHHCQRVGEDQEHRAWLGRQHWGQRTVIKRQVRLEAAKSLVCLGSDLPEVERGGDKKCFKIYTRTLLPGRIRSTGHLAATKRAGKCTKSPCRRMPCPILIRGWRDSPPSSPVLMINVWPVYSLLNQHTFTEFLYLLYGPNRTRHWRYREELIIKYSRMLHGSCQTQWLEIEHGRRIYISDIAKCYKQGFLLFFFFRELPCSILPSWIRLPQWGWQSNGFSSKSTKLEIRAETSVAVTTTHQFFFENSRNCRARWQTSESDRPGCISCCQHSLMIRIR